VKKSAHFFLIGAAAVCWEITKIPAIGVPEAKPSNAPSFVIAQGGEARAAITVSSQADEKTREAATTLAEMLGRISGGEFSVMVGDGSSGIVVGTVTEFPALAGGVDFAPDDPTRRDEYLMRSQTDSLRLIGATPLAARHAVWDLLYRLGYRQYFPGETWEIIPESPDLSIAVDSLETPDYILRRFFYQYGSYPESMLVFRDWLAKNRAGEEGFVLRTAHTWCHIVRANKDLFLENPDWLAMDEDGNRRSMLRGDGRPSTTIKVNVGNEDLRRFMVQNALERLKNQPDADSISIDPSDGGGWCQSEESAALGSVSDQVVTLANEVAGAVTAVSPGTRVGFNAYHQHGMPPTIPVHPAMIVSVATGLTKGGGMTALELMEAWRKMGATIGTREYYSIYAWHRDTPGGQLAANLQYIVKSLRDFHDVGSRYITIEGSNNWAPAGLGYFLAARTLWDLDEGNRAEEIVEDFLNKSFGAAKEPMRKFYRLMRGGRERLPFSTDMVGRMFGHIQEARELEPNPKVQERLDDLALYARYLELYLIYTNAEEEARQQAYEEMTAHALRMRFRGMVHSLAVHRDLPVRDKAIHIPEDRPVFPMNVEKNKNPWLHQQEFSQEEILQIEASGIANNPLADFDHVPFGDEFVPATPLVEALGVSLDGLPQRPRFETGGRGGTSYLIWVDEGQDVLKIETDFAGVLQLMHDSSEEPVAAADLTEFRSGERVLRKIEMPLRETGLHTLHLEGAMRGGNTVLWEDHVKVSVEAGNFPFWATNFTYFYVPKGTEVIGGFSQPVRTRFLDADGKQRFCCSKLEATGHFSIPVQPGQDGKFWQIHSPSASLRLLTVPHLLARSPAHLLLPAEVVERDLPAGAKSGQSP